jgi:hypothetical protein
MKTTNFRTVEELNLDVNAPTVTPTKVQMDKVVRTLKKLSISNPDENSDHQNGQCLPSAGPESSSQIF